MNTAHPLISSQSAAAVSQVIKGLDFYPSNMDSSSTGTHMSYWRASRRASSQNWSSVKPNVTHRHVQASTRSIWR